MMKTIIPAQPGFDIAEFNLDTFEYIAIIAWYVTVDDDDDDLEALVYPITASSECNERSTYRAIRQPDGTILAPDGATFAKGHEVEAFAHMVKLNERRLHLDRSWDKAKVPDWMFPANLPSIGRRGCTATLARRRRRTRLKTQTASVRRQFTSSTKTAGGASRDGRIGSRGVAAPALSGPTIPIKSLAGGLDLERPAECPRPCA
jgi:hypothetical protein